MRPVLGCCILILSFSVHAQMPAQSIYYGSQWAGYYERQWQKNNFSKKNIAVAGMNGIPITCKAGSQEQASLWELGEGFFKRNRWEEAVRVYGACIFTDSAFCDPYFRLAQCLIVKNDFGKALRVLKIAERKFPGEPMVYLGLGQVSILTGSLEKGLLYYQQLKQQAPDDPEGYFGCSMALTELGRYEEALDNTEEAVLRSPAQACLLLEGILYFKTNQTQKAIAQLGDLLPHFDTEELRSTEKWRKYFLGLSYFAKGERYYTEAKQNLQQAAQGGIQIDSTISKNVGLATDPTDFKNRALLEFYDDDLNCASDRKSKSENHEADLYFENRNLDTALALYERAIRENSFNCHAAIKLAECYQLRGRQRDALNLYRTAYQQNPSEKNIGLLLARQLFRLDSLPSSLRTYQEVIRLDSVDSRAYVGASLLLAHRGEKEEALDLLVRRENPNGYTPWNIVSTEGILYYYLGDIDNALKYLKKASYHEKDVCIDYYLAICYFAQGERLADKARKHMRRALSQGAIVSPAIEKKFGVNSKSIENRLPP